MASIVPKKRKSGTSYYIAYRITGENGKIQQKWYPCKNKREANNLLEEVEEAENQNREYVRYEPKSYTGEVIVPNSMTVEELVYKYVEHRSTTGKWEAKTRQNSLSCIKNYIVPYIGNTPIACVTTRFLQEYYNDLPNHKAVPGNHKTPPKNISARTVREVHKILRPAFSLAIKWGELSLNPAYNLELPKIEKFTRKQWTENEFVTAVSSCDNKELELIMSVMFACTLRSGELSGLTWDCIDCSESAISSDSAYVHVKKELARLDKSAIQATNTKIYLTFPCFKADTKSVMVLKKPKTDSSVRKIYVPSSIAVRLKEHKKIQQDWIQSIGNEYHDFNLVFAQPNGFPYSNNTLGKHFKRYLREKGIEIVDFYSLRHSGATAKLRATKNVKAVQGDMGHNTSQMLMNVYAAIADEDRKNNAKELENHIFSKVSEKKMDVTDKS